MAEEVYMDIPQVQQMSKSFQTFGDVLDGVAKAIGIIAAMLHATWWLSLGASEAVARYLDNIKPNVEKAAAKMHELSTDVADAVKAYAEGDRTGSTRFA
jgi:hypothetical protein